MPNLVPPLTSVNSVKAYYSRLTAIGPSVRYLMTLYLHPDVTPQTIREAKESGVIWGVKSYPAGVTTNSDAGVLSYEDFYPVFEEMQRLRLVLNLHGECPNDKEAGIDVMNAESKFLPTLRELHRRFPDLKVGSPGSSKNTSIGVLRFSDLSGTLYLGGCSGGSEGVGGKCCGHYYGASFVPYAGRLEE
jgi:dihydroorotase (homodimeric type)